MEFEEPEWMPEWMRPVITAPIPPKGKPKRVKAKKLIARVNKLITRLPAPTRLMPITCECCGKPRMGKQLHLDHDHITGKFRGWLCGQCNSAIGLLGDNEKGVALAWAYLRRTMDHS